MVLSCLPMVVSIKEKTNAEEKEVLGEKVGGVFYSLKEGAQEGLPDIKSVLEGGG